MRSSDFHSNPLFLLLVIFSNKLHFRLKFSMLEIFFFFFWKVYIKLVKQFIYVNIENKKSHTHKKIQCMFSSDIFCSMNSKSARVKNSKFCLCISLISMILEKQRKQNKNLKPNMDIEKSSVISFKFHLQDATSVLYVFEDAV